MGGLSAAVFPPINPDCTGTVGKNFVLCGEAGYYCSDRCWTIGRLRAPRAQVAAYEQQLAVYSPKSPDQHISTHLAYVEADLESFCRGGTCRVAICFCGWREPQRGTLALAADDALALERDAGSPERA